MADGRPGRARSEEARLAILRAARDELRLRGYDKLSFDRVAVAAGVSKQTIYRWYATKSALVAEGVLYGHLSPTIPVPDSSDVRADISAWMHAFAAGSGHPEGAALLRATVAATAESESVATQYEREVTQVTREALKTRIGRGVDAGQIRADAPQDALVDALLGSVMIRVLARSAITRSNVDDLVDLLFRGLSPTQPGPIPA